VTDLRHDSRAVVNDGKDSFAPTQADRLRVTELLTQRLGASALGVASNAHAASSLVSHHGFVPWLKVIGTAGLVAIGGAFYLANEKAPDVLPAPGAVATHPSALLATQREQATNRATEPEPVESATTIQPVPAERTPRSHRSRGDSLGEEVAILTLAGKELHNGRPASALKALDEHQRRFPSGALAQERSAARIQALCALGRTSQAEAESARLARTAPQMTRAEHPCSSH
jgi:hypothetical protein